MAAPAATAPGGPSLTFRGRAYPILLPKLRDPRLHLAAVIFSLQILGQVAFDFRVSIAQILLSLATCAVLEVGIAAWRQHILLWPASALITGNGVSFILRVPGTQHGDWWSLHGWWIYVGTAAVSLLSKHLIQIRGGHIFNPSNFGLVLCFLVLPRTMAEPLDFWWGPMSPWLALAFAIIVGGAVAILTRLKLLGIAVGFWLAFAAGIGVLAATGHAMSARWHLGPITGAYFWWTLVTSPEILVFLFFMITDPRTTPRGQKARVVYAVCVGLLAALLIAPRADGVRDEGRRPQLAGDRLRGASVPRTRPGAATRAAAARAPRRGRARTVRRRARRRRSRVASADDGLCRVGVRPVAGDHDPPVERRRRRAGTPSVSADRGRPRGRSSRARERAFASWARCAPARLDWRRARRADEAGARRCRPDDRRAGVPTRPPPGSPRGGPRPGPRRRRRSPRRDDAADGVPRRPAGGRPPRRAEAVAGDARARAA